jgi:hypothetical protein
MSQLAISSAASSGLGDVGNDEQTELLEQMDGGKGGST